MFVVRSVLFLFVYNAAFRVSVTVCRDNSSKEYRDCIEMSLYTSQESTDGTRDAETEQSKDLVIQARQRSGRIDTNEKVRGTLWDRHHIIDTRLYTIYNVPQDMMCHPFRPVNIIRVEGIAVFHCLTDDPFVKAS